jgi:8-oxo-dGTP pyrophosphatase MutT (NUDIX family)
MEYYKELRQYVGHKPLILPGAAVIIVNDKGEILLQSRHDHIWGLPGGLMELGESFEETARREVLEETGLSLGKLRLLDVFSGSHYYFKISNGDEFYAATVVYTTKEYQGELKLDLVETMDLKFFSLNDLPKQLGKGYQKYVNVYVKSLGSNAK